MYLKGLFRLEVKKKDRQHGCEEGQSHLNWLHAQKMSLFTVCVCACVGTRERVLVYPLSSVKHFRINLFVESCL